MEFRYVRLSTDKSVGQYQEAITHKLFFESTRDLALENANVFGISALAIAMTEEEAQQFTLNAIYKLSLVPISS